MRLLAANHIGSVLRSVRRCPPVALRACAKGSKPPACRPAPGKAPTTARTAWKNGSAEARVCLRAARRARLTHLPSFRRKPINQRQPVQTLLEPFREIVDPALAAQIPPLPDLLHR